MQYVLRTKNIKDRAIAAVEAVDPNLSDAMFEVVIRPYKSRRSLEQNKLLHAIFRDVSDQYAESRGQRFSPDSWKIYFKRLFLGSDPILLPDGSVGVNAVSTTALSSVQMTALIESVLHHCSEELEIFVDIPAIEYSA
tara:strand:- start:348 stop:761 length:414 start_codon:yes stop_codon:yes gene_type:complete